MYRLLYIFCCILLPYISTSQQIARAEYFFDTDPGFGNGISLSVVSADTVLINQPITIPAGLSQGLHILFARVQSNDGLWGMPEATLLNISDAGSSIVAAEYFFDTDPGLGNGSVLNFAATDTANTDDNITMPAGLTTGQHTLYVRAKNASGNWGMPERYVFNICGDFGPTSRFGHYLAGNEVFFSDSSLNTISRQWLYGDGQSDTTVNPKHVYEAAGVYSVTLITTNNCGTDTLRRNVSVTGIQSITPANAPQTGLYVGYVKGAGFEPGSKVRLSNNGTSFIPADTTMYVNATTLKVIFKNSLLPLGDYSVYVSIPSSGEQNLVNALTIEPATNHNIWVSLQGNRQILINRWATYKVLYGNNGNKTAVGIPIVISMPGDVEARLASPIDNGDLQQVWIDATVDHFYVINDSVTGKTSRFAYLLIPNLEPGQTGEIVFEMKVAAAGGNVFPVNIQTGDPFYNESTVKVARLATNGRVQDGEEPFICFPPCVQCIIDLISSVPGLPTPVGCGIGLMNAACGIGNSLTGGGSGPKKALDVIGQLGGAFLGCTPLDQVIKVFDALENIKWGAVGLSVAGNVANNGGSAFNVGNSCPSCLKDGDLDSISKRFTADPNIKTGPTGYNTMKYTRSQYPFNYTIEFENMPSATAPVTFVEITDYLDSTKFNLSSFKFTGFGFADSSVHIDGNTFVRDVDLRPAKNAIVRVEGRLDSVNKIVVQYTAFDPATMKLTEDFMQGFLNPNVNGTEGHGYISYQLRPKADLPTGTIINNIATIVFDNNAPIITPLCFNGIDKNKPASNVLPVTEKLNDTTYRIRWAGVDNHSGIRSYSVYVSINDSAYILWETTDSLQMTFSVKNGNIYKFYTVAKDYVGNIENDAASADQVLSVSLPVTFRDFDVFKRNDKAELIWSTASEQNNRGFEILRGKDNNNMTPIGFVNGAGTSNSVSRYTFRDDSPFEGINYYRLKQVDLDGKISYSAVRHLTFTKTGYLTVMPNPVTDRLFIGINAGLISEILITDVNGRAVWQKMNINTSSISFTLVQLPKGMYFIRLTDSNGKQSTQKLIKQ